MSANDLMIPKTRSGSCRMDESPKQPIEDVMHTPMQPGPEQRIDYEYIRRHGQYIYANEPLQRRRVVRISDRKTKKYWVVFITHVSESYPEANNITLVMDNFKTYQLSAFYNRFSSEEARRLRDRFNFVFTPKHGAWLNMVEIELHVLHKQCLGRHLYEKEKVIREIEAWEAARNSKNL